MAAEAAPPSLRVRARSSWHAQPEVESRSVRAAGASERCPRRTVDAHAVGVDVASAALALAPSATTTHSAARHAAQRRAARRRAAALEGLGLWGEPEPGGRVGAGTTRRRWRAVVVVRKRDLPTQRLPLAVDTVATGRTNAPMALARHVLLELDDVDPAILSDVEALERALRQAAQAARCTIVGAVSHRYAPHGASVVLLVAESHLSIHTWPERRYAAVDIFTCGATLPSAGVEVLVAALGAPRHRVQVIERGDAPDPPTRPAMG
jgi:S-adenosylmethionine decarboxylase